MDNIKNKVVVVTGGASGIGYACVTELLRNGAKAVAIFDLSTSPGVTSVETLEKEFGKGRALFLVCDVTNTEQLKDSFKKTVDTFKRIDILINNAGILNDALWERCIDINVKGLIQATLIALDYMGKHKGGDGGTIVNLCSIASLTFFGPIPVYTASKYAVYGFSGAMATNYETTGVRILSICPGVTETPLTANLSKHLLDVIKPETAIAMMQSHPMQKREDVAHAMMKFIQEGKNGATWVISGGRPPYSVKFPYYEDIGVPV